MTDVSVMYIAAETFVPPTNSSLPVPCKSSNLRTAPDTHTTLREFSVPKTEMSGSSKHLRECKHPHLKLPLNPGIFQLIKCYFLPWFGRLELRSLSGGKCLSTSLPDGHYPAHQITFSSWGKLAEAWIWSSHVYLVPVFGCIAWHFLLEIFILREGMWGLRFSRWCCWGFKSSGMWRRVVVWVAPDVSKDSFAFNFKVQAVQLLGLPEPCQRRRQCFSKFRELLTQRHGFTSRRNLSIVSVNVRIAHTFYIWPLVRPTNIWRIIFKMCFV